MSPSAEPSVKSRTLASASVMVPLQKGAGAIEVFGPDEQLDLQTSGACEPGLILTADFALYSFAVQRSPHDLRFTGIVCRIDG